MKLLQSWLFLLYFLSDLSAQQTRQPDYAIVHVTIINVAMGTRLPNQTVLIDSNRIMEIYPDRTGHFPKKTRVINARHQFLIPGLWDMHVHIESRDELPLYLVNGVTGVRLMEGPPDAAAARRVYEGDSLCPRVIIGSPVLEGGPPYNDAFTFIRSPEEARLFVDSQKVRGSDFIKIYNKINKYEFFAIAEECRLVKIPFAGHLPYAVSALDASEAGQASFEHLYGLGLACSSREATITQKGRLLNTWDEYKTLIPQIYESYDPHKAAHLFGVLVKNKTWQVPTLVLSYAANHLNDTVFQRDSRLRYFSRELAESWLPQNDPEHRDWSQQDYMEQRKNYHYLEGLVRAMSRAGVGILAGTDALNPYCFPGFSLHDELGLLVKAGLSPLKALQTATLNPAIFLHTASQEGNIGKGFLANLVLLDADPLVRIGNTKKISAVWLRGKCFDRKYLDGLLIQALQKNQ